MSGVDPDPLINLALAIAQRRCAEHPEIAAAYAAYDADLANAWKEDPEFGNALHWAVALGDIRPLKQYLCSDKPLSRMNKRALAGYIDLLVERKALPRRHGKARIPADVTDAMIREARKEADGDPEPIRIEENDTAFAIDWKGRYRIDGSAFVYFDRETGNLTTIHGYPTHKLTRSLSPQLCWGD